MRPSVFLALIVGGSWQLGAYRVLVQETEVGESVPDYQKSPSAQIRRLE